MPYNFPSVINTGCERWKASHLFVLVLMFIVLGPNFINLFLIVCIFVNIPLPKKSSCLNSYAAYSVNMRPLLLNFLSFSVPTVFGIECIAPLQLSAAPPVRYCTKTNSFSTIPNRTTDKHLFSYSVTHILSVQHYIIFQFSCTGFCLRDVVYVMFKVLTLHATTPWTRFCDDVVHTVKFLTYCTIHSTK